MSDRFFKAGGAAAILAGGLFFCGTASADPNFFDDFENGVGGTPNQGLVIGSPNNSGTTVNGINNRLTTSSDHNITPAGVNSARAFASDPAAWNAYSDFGTSTNPKVSFRFQPAESLLFRGSYSTGFRAPSLYEIHSAQSYTNTAGTYDDPVTCPGGTPNPGKSAAANCSQQFQALLGGNNNLQPEKSRNATLGVVLEPMKDLSVGIDLWAISLKNSIGQMSQDDIFADPVKFAALYHRNPAEIGRASCRERVL